MLMHTEITEKATKFPFLAPKAVEAGHDADIPAIPMSFGRNAEIYGEGERSGYAYKVLSGVVRVYQLLPDGRRQISGFHMAGDMFGLEPDETRHFSAEAVVPTKVLAIKWQNAARSASYLRELLQSAMKDLRHSQEHLLLLGRKNALERLISFLREMAERGSDKHVIELPMPRHDIADYLGLTLETVSRMFAELKDLGVIKLQGARRVLLDNHELAAMCS